MIVSRRIFALISVAAVSVLHEAALRPETGATLLPSPEGLTTGPSLPLSTLLVGNRGKLIDDSEYIVVRGARADNGDELVERVPIALLDEFKQPRGVGSVIGESGCGRLIATIVERRRDVRFTLQLVVVQS
ncbi:uncharacterized protein N7473_011516 [Penicillium subrubescens]|uniref:uncharacterized protein n=1 Tax=Penicillium subrubescens TaxID=1316194 RepID=UPI0025453CF7|nr:uncharacterized protein N7473_011516 [Penicillium subrubescens]KAJ5880463.1 hypothetical protein N7473_011516 [Penicillium subrubescens]